MVEITKLNIGLTDSLQGVIGSIASAFQSVGWVIVNQTTDEVTVKSPQALYPNKYLFVTFTAPPNENLTYGINVSVYKQVDANGNPTGTPVTLGSTINSIGEYILVANETAFFLIPPVTQTHRFRYGTWAGLLKTVEFAPAAITQGNNIPLFLLADRMEGALYRDYPHTEATSPTHVIITPADLNFNTFLPLRFTHGYRWAQDRGISKIIITPLTLGAVFGENLLPILYAPNIFLIWKPENQFYYAPPSTERDFLIETETPIGRLTTVAEAPFGGAYLAAM